MSSMSCRLGQTPLISLVADSFLRKFGRSIVVVRFLWASGLYTDQPLFSRLFDHLWASCIQGSPRPRAGGKQGLALGITHTAVKFGVQNYCLNRCESNWFASKPIVLRTDRVQTKSYYGTDWVQNVAILGRL